MKYTGLKLPCDPDISLTKVLNILVPVHVMTNNKAHIPPAVAIRAWSTFKENDNSVKYCKFGNFLEDFIFAKCRMRSFVKIKTSRKGKIKLSFIDIGKSCLSREFFTSLICL